MLVRTATRRPRGAAAVRFGRAGAQFVRDLDRTATGDLDARLRLLPLKAAGVLKEGSPGHIDVNEVRTMMAATPGVQEIYDLHVWSVTSGAEALSAHVVVDDPDKSGPLIQSLRISLHDRFGIDHTTIKVDAEGPHRDKDCVF